MSKEVKAMKEVKVTERRFQNVNTKSRNTIFIKTLVDNPCDLTHQILSDIMESGVQKSRFAIRMLPIENICKARMNDMEECGKELFKRYFETPLGTGLSYTTQFTRRNNTDISREHAIPRLGQIVKDFNPLHRVNHKNPDYVILVEIIGSLCLMSVLKDFFKLKKYNLIEASKVKHSQGKSASEGTGLDDQHSTNVESTGENTPDLGESTSDLGVEGEKQAEIASSENNQIELTGNTSQQSPRKRKAPSLSKEDTVIVPALPQNKTVVMETLDRSKTVVMETMPRSETVVMESMPRSETVVMENVERKDSVMDALSGGESVMQMSVKLDSVMDVLPSGESVMENGDDDDELDLT